MMNNETICSICGTLVRLDDVRYIKDAPVCKTCQHAVVMGEFHDCTMSPEDGCECCRCSGIPF
jgi:hypothetical protein